ncbi:hypothetical protein XHV734_3332 [Xanthomonas hortorum pv. vitians]|nr:hypothetical protein XHV734_3332 [Xanthomonas hortorum pv. vitians]
MRYDVLSPSSSISIPWEDVATIARNSENNRFPELNLHPATKNPKEEAH